MSKLVCLSLFLIPFLAFAQPEANGSGSGAGSSTMMHSSSTQGIQWVTDYAMGMDQAKRENKPVFLYFTGSDWCGWCKKLDQEALSQPAFAQSIGNQFVFIKLDFPMNRNSNDSLMQQNTKLKQQYGVTGFPTVILLDAQGTFIAETGYRSGGGEAYATYIKQLIQPQS